MLNYIVGDKVINTDYKEHYFLFALDAAEGEYFNLIEMGCKPQEAREVLPLALKTEVVMTGFKSQ